MNYLRISISFLLLACTQAQVAAMPTVIGNVISWPDDGWYQVQLVTEEGISEVCQGTRNCEVEPGTYIVINHTTRERFEGIVVSAEPEISELTITGNTITWPDDGWYQVQAVTDEGIFEVCQGTRFCEVPDGEYIVINHTTGVRYEDIIINESDSGSVVTVTGNTISWPDDGWYQVQAVTDEGIFEVCQGTRFCEVPDGEYIVINHTTGTRYEDIIVNELHSGSVVTVTGNTISWTDDGWYQVQAVTDEGIFEVCQGTRFCEVPDGEYIVINHSTGERFAPVIVNSDSMTPDPEDLPIIRAQTWQEILRNVVSLINADRALERHEMILTRFSTLSNQVIAETLAGDTSGTLASLGLTLLPLADPDNNFLVDYACNAQGTLNFALEPGVNIYAIKADSCPIDGDVYDGGFNYAGVGREGISSRMDNMSVTLANGTAYALDGGYSTFFDRVGVRRSVQWVDAAMTERSENDDYSVESFSLLSESIDDRGFGVNPQFQHGATIQGSFSVSANWSDSEALQVTFELALGGSYPQSASNLFEPPSQWSSGSVEVIAPDGSQLTLRPVAENTNTALVEVSGINEPQQILWSDGYQVRCFANPDEFPDCQ